MCTPISLCRLFSVLQHRLVHLIRVLQHQRPLVSPLRHDTPPDGILGRPAGNNSIAGDEVERRRAQRLHLHEAGGVCRLVTALLEGAEFPISRKHLYVVAFDG